MTFLIILNALSVPVIGICLHLQYIVGFSRRIDKIILTLLCYTLFIATTNSIVYFFLPNYLTYLIAAPLYLFYGPTLYMAMNSIRHKEMNRKQYILHYSFFIIWTLNYLFFLTSSEVRNARFYFLLLELSTAISWMAYSIWGIFSSSNFPYSPIERKIKSLFIPLFLILFTVSLYMLILFFNQKAEYTDIALRLPIYSITLGLPFIIYLLLISQFSEIPIRKVKKEENEKIPTQYAKAQIKDEVVDQYICKLKEYLEKEPYLRSNFTLAILSKDLKISKHNLSYLFNQVFEQDFPTYINTKRIAFACKLLETETSEYSNEDIAFLSGFESRSSFYRNFKKIKHCTPKEYKERINNKKINQSKQ